MKIKKELYNKCVSFIENRLLLAQKSFEEIQEALTAETKSSAGDKHETGRAMLQLEREKVGNQLAEIEKTKEHLTRIDIQKTSENISIGNLVYTSGLNYFIAISAGEIELKGVKFFAISPSTPIARLLLSKQVDDTIQFRNTTFVIEKIA